MRYATIATAALLGMTSLSALAQTPSSIDPTTGTRPGHAVGVGDSLPHSNKASNIVPSDTRSVIAPTLPQSAAGNDAATRDYLKAARASLIAGHSGQAQQSLEMAETRTLNRSVEQGQTGTASQSTLVSQIRDARHALGNRDSTHAIQFIDLALSS
jgi:hypothetical protein